MNTHPEQCDKCGRFPFEKCIKPGQRGCPRNVVSVVQAVVPTVVCSAPAPVTTRPKQNLAIESRAKGYTGDVCRECSNFTMVRNGTCLKCDTCGATSGCS